jgi:hypothetical protein
VLKDKHVSCQNVWRYLSHDDDDDDIIIIIIIIIIIKTNMLVPNIILFDIEESETRGPLKRHGSDMHSKGVGFKSRAGRWLFATDTFRSLSQSFQANSEIQDRA